MEYDEFAEYLRARGLAEATVGVYVTDVRLSCGAAGVLRRLRDDSLAPKTRKHILAAARHYAEWADDERLSRALKTMRLPPARRQAARVPVDEQQLRALLDALRNASDIAAPVRAVIGLMASRGMRVGDVLRLRRTDVAQGLSSGVLSFTAKGARRVEYPVLRTFRRWLEMLLAAGERWSRVSDLISPGARGDHPRHAAARAVERALTKLAVRVGIQGMHPHRLRRTYAVLYLQQLRGDSEALPKLTQHMGWQSLHTAFEYVDHARGQELDDVAERMLGD